MTTKLKSTPTHTMKLIALFALLASLCPLFAADNSKTAADPFDGAFFPPELVMLPRDRIALTSEQEGVLRARVEKTQARSEELRAKMERETAALSAIAKQDHVDESALGVQLDKVLDVEREVKHLHVGLLGAIKNLLTPDQQAKLREIAKDGGAQFAQGTRKRLSEKVERVQAGEEKWASSGRDPSAIAKAMEEKVKPLLDAGKIIEAEAELDRILELLKQGGQ
ncbi:MAG: Spy/CpxP family protein refolding chaperone [Limisphaerales bacterium]